MYVGVSVKLLEKVKGGYKLVLLLYFLFQVGKEINGIYQIKVEDWGLEKLRDFFLLIVRKDESSFK